jgi:hypothetical protein
LRPDGVDGGVTTPPQLWRPRRNRRGYRRIPPPRVHVEFASVDGGFEVNDNFPELEIALQVWRNWDPTYTPVVVTFGLLILLAYLYRKVL